MATAVASSDSIVAAAAVEVASFSAASTGVNPLPLFWGKSIVGVGDGVAVGVAVGKGVAVGTKLAAVGTGVWRLAKTAVCRLSRSILGSQSRIVSKISATDMLGRVGKASAR